MIEIADGVIALLARERGLPASGRLVEIERLEFVAFGGAVAMSV